jgi:hypothetical protein
MVKGLEIFKEHFKDHNGKYILIGGAACDLWFSEAGGTFRATKDLDIILVVEALDSSFFESFWDFIRKGRYREKHVEEKEKKYYRFREPAEENFPFQLELFSRKPDSVKLPFDVHLTPIPAVEDFSSLSAILLDDMFYDFVKENSLIKNDYHLLNVKGLICLKMKAYLNLLESRNKGFNVSDREIKKHRNDVFRLIPLLMAEDKVLLPEEIKDLINKFLEDIKINPPDFNSLKKDLKSGGIETDLSPGIINERLKATFDL